MAYTFPSGRFDTLDLLSQTMSNFWLDLFADQQFVADYLRAAALQEAQLDRLSSELFDSMGRQTCPLFHTCLFLPIELLESQREASGALWQFPAPADLAECPVIVDSMVETSSCLINGTDFILDRTDSLLQFAVDPFFDERFTPYTDDDGIRRVRIYLFRAQLDWQYVQNLYGTVIGLSNSLPASQELQDLVNAVLDGVAGCPCQQNLVEAIAALTGTPVAAGDETVELITTDVTGLIIATDDAIYRFPAAATPIVSIGQQIQAGDQLVDTVAFYLSVNGAIPRGLSSISLPATMFTAGVNGPLTFNNASESITVTTGVSGYTKITWAMGGAAGDASAFFAAMHANGVAAGKTLANYLDIRPSPIGQPTALNLPSAVNPMALLFANVLRYNFTLVLIKVAQLGVNAVGLAQQSVLDYIVQPSLGVLIQTE